MYKYSISIIAVVLLFSSCQKEKDRFLVNKNFVGLLTDTTQVKNLKMAFPEDSIVNYKGDSIFKLPMNLVEVYDGAGKMLLILTPSKMSDSTATINNIRIVDPRYKTEKGISNLSTFKDIQDNYKISKIDNLINSVVITVNELNAQFAIDKKELPSSLRFDMNLNIEESQIPDAAKIQYFFINWY